jgi:MFS family permease
MNRGALVPFLNIGHFVDHLAMLIFPVVVVALAREWQQPYAELLPLALGGFIAFGAFALPAGWLADHWSRYKMMAVFFFGIGGAMFLTGFAQSAWQVGVGLFVIGMFAAIYHPVGIAMLVAAPEKMGRALGWNGLWGNLGLAAAALISGALMDWLGWRAACAEAAQGQVVDAVNFNAPGQIVIAGHKEAVARAMELCKAKGAKRALPLPVSAPFHSSLMRPAAERLRGYLAGVAVAAPACQLINNVDVRVETQPDAIKDALVRQAAAPVRWVETVQQMRAQGVTHVLECGPGKVLAGMVKRIDGSLQSFALSDKASLEQALAAVKGD